MACEVQDGPPETLVLLHVFFFVVWSKSLNLICEMGRPALTWERAALFLKKCQFLRSAG